MAACSFARTRSSNDRGNPPPIWRKAWCPQRRVAAATTGRNGWHGAEAYALLQLLGGCGALPGTLSAAGCAKLRHYAPSAAWAA